MNGFEIYFRLNKWVETFPYFLGYKTVPDYEKLHQFQQKGYLLIYRSVSVSGKNILNRSHFSHFVGVEGDNTLIRKFIPVKKYIHIKRRKMDNKLGRDGSLLILRPMGPKISKYTSLPSLLLKPITELKYWNGIQ